MTVRLVVCGGRDFHDKAHVDGKLDQVIAHLVGEVIVVSGGCQGADRLAQEYAKNRGLRFEEYPADWAKYGKRAGYVRNKAMAEIGDILVAFPGGRGTQMMIRLANEHGLIVHEPQSSIHEQWNPCVKEPSILKEEADHAYRSSAELAENRLGGIHATGNR